MSAKHANKITGRVLREATAWDLIGWDSGLIRIRGGRAIYEAVMYNCSRNGKMVKLARLDSVLCDDGVYRLSEVKRYVNPDTMIEILEEQP